MTRDLTLIASKLEQFAQYVDEAVYFFQVMGLMDRKIFQADYKIKVNIFDDAS